MSISMVIGVCIAIFTLGYIVGVIKGVNSYHKHLISEGKIHEK